MTAATSVEGDLLRYAVRSLIGHLDTPRDVTRHLLALARDFDLDVTGTPPPILTGRWVRRTKGNGGPGVPGLGHVAADRCAGLDDAVGVCGRSLRGALDWGTPARRGNHADGWRPCRACMAAVAATTEVPAQRRASTAAGVVLAPATWGAAPTSSTRRAS